jgi:hypothetical protein
MAAGDEIKLVAVERKCARVSLEKTHIGDTPAGRQVPGFFEHGERDIKSHHLGHVGGKRESCVPCPRPNIYHVLLACEGCDFHNPC